MSLTKQEEVMGQPFPSQHPAVVLRSHFKLVRALLIVAMAAIVALSAAVVIVANDDEVSGTSSSSSGAATALPNPTVHSHPLETAPTPGTRYDGGPDEGTRAIIPVPQAPPARYDGGPEEGARTLGSTPPAPAPERTTERSSDSSEPIVIPQGPGGTR
jgi:hypothetical protein